MRKEELFEAIGEIDEKKIEAAGKAFYKRKKTNLVKICATAACLALAVVAVLYTENRAPKNPVDYTGTNDKYIHTLANPTLEDYESINENAWKSEEEIAKEDENRYFGVFVPAFVAYDGALYTGAAYDNEEKLFFPTDSYLYFNSTYRYQAYAVKDREDLVAIFINGGMTVYRRLFDVSVVTDEKIFSIKHRADMNTEYILGDMVFENDDFAVYHGKNAHTGEDSTEYLVNISKKLKRELSDAFGGDEKYGEFWWIADVQDIPKDAAADEGGGIYMEAVSSDELSENAAEIFCGSYIDKAGNYVILLTENTPENRAAICREIGISEENAVFAEGAYTLRYLTELQRKISDAMIRRELVQVVSSGVYESDNRIRVGVLKTDEETVKKLEELDTLGGAIIIEETEKITIASLEKEIAK